MNGFWAPKHRCPCVPKAETCSLSPGLRRVHGCPKASVLVPAEHPWAPRALGQVGDNQSQSNTLLGPTSPESSWSMTAEVLSDGAETCKLQKKLAAQKAPSTNGGGKGRDWCPAGLGQESQTRHRREGGSLSWDKDTPERTSGLSQKGCKGVKPGLLDEGLQQKLKSSSSCLLRFAWLSN